MTVKEVAALLRVSPQTLYKMLEHRQIPAVKVGSQWRFDRDQIREWIRKQSGAVETESAEDVGVVDAEPRRQRA